MSKRFDTSVVWAVRELYDERLKFLTLEKEKGIVSDIPGQKERYEEFMNKCWFQTKRDLQDFIDEVDRMNALAEGSLPKV